VKNGDSAITPKDPAMTRIKEGKRKESEKKKAERKSTAEDD